MRGSILGIILGMALVTFLPRFLPMALLSKWVLPEKVEMGLSYIPVAILATIVFPALFSDGARIGIYPQYLLTAFAIFIFAWKIKSLWGSVVLGMLIYWLLGFVI